MKECAFAAYSLGVSHYLCCRTHIHNTSSMQRGFEEKDKQAVIQAVRTSGHDVECEDALHRACELGWIDVAQLLINKFCLDPNVSDFWGTKLRPIHVAARSGRLEVIEFLVANGASVDLEDANGDTALHYSLQEGRWEIAEYLHNSGNGNVVKRNVYGVMPLTLGLNRAVDSHDRDGITRCIELYRTSPTQQSSFSIPYSTLQTLHCHQWNEELRLLVQFTAEKEASASADSTAMPLSLIAASNGDLELLKALVDYGAAISATDTYGDTVLHVALLKGYGDVVRYVINVAPHLVSATNKKGESCVRFAVRSGSVDMVKLLVEKGAQIEAEDKNKETPLFSALKEHHIAMTEYLVNELHCDLNHKNKDGDTPFSTELTSLLYRHDIDNILWLLELNIKSKKTFATLPNNALQLACKENLLPVVKVLLQQYHCDPLQPHSYTGMTAFHIAYQIKDLPLAKVLLSQKPPNPLAQNKSGESLVDLAQGHEELLKLLDIAQLKRVCRARKPIKIFLLGGSQSGKTSLARLLKKSAKRDMLGSIRVVKRKPPTLGVKVTTINHKDFGSAIMYDCSSHERYYAIIAALIEDLVASMPAIFIVAVNLTQSKDEVAREVQYWVSFVRMALQPLSSDGSQVIVVGSHADQSSINQWGFQNAYQSWVAEDAEPRVVAEKLVLAGGIMMDCHRGSSTRHLVSLVSQSCASIRVCSVIPLQLEHLALYSFCYYHFKSITSVLLFELQAAIEAEQSHHALPLEEASLVESLEYLHAKGLVLFLYDKHTPSNSVIVFDRTSLLNKELGTLLAPPDYKVHHPINSSTGMVQLADILQLLPQHDGRKLLLFFAKYSLCIEVADPSAVTGNPLLFFPSLISLEKSDASLQVYNDGHQSGWMLSCSSDQLNAYFNHRFTDLLQLTLAERFVSLTIKDTTTPPAHSIWKSGIYWVNSVGIEVAVEVSEDRNHLILLLSSPSGSELKAVKLRSQLIRCILQLLSQYCQHSVGVTEYLISPDQIQYPLVCDYKDLFVCPLDHLSLALQSKDAEVQFSSATSNEIMITSLQEVLYYDTHQLPHEILATLADLISRGETSLPLDLLSDIASSLCGLVSGKMLALEILAMDLASLGDKSELLEVLQMWAGLVENGPLSLRKALDNCSIFWERPAKPYL